MSEVRLNCPYCVAHGKSPDTRRHLYVNTASNLFFCQRCNEAGVWDDSIPMEQPKITQNKFEDIDIFSFDYVPQFSKRMAGIREKVLAYGLTRLPKEIIYSKAAWSPDLPERLIFPMWHPSISGVIICWQGRAIVPDIKPKYLTCGIKSEYVYEYDSVEEWAVLCEGPIDALSTPHGIAILGKCLSKFQIDMIGSKYLRVYWFLDKDTVNEKKVVEQKKELAKYVSVIDIPFENGDGKDANEIGYDKMIEKLRRLGEKI